MSSSAVFAASFVFLFVLASSATSGETLDKIEPRSLEGTWRLIDAVFPHDTRAGYEERRVKIDDASNCVIEVKGGKFTIHDGESRSEFPIKTRHVSGQNKLDFVEAIDGVEGEGKAPVRCIYSIEKDASKRDRLRIQFHFGIARWGSPYFHPLAPRPADFGASEYPGVIFTFQRTAD